MKTKERADVAHILTVCDLVLLFLKVFQKPMASVEEKLKRFQSVCEDKLRKTEVLKQVYEKNEKLLLDGQISAEDRLEISQLRLQLAQKQFKFGTDLISILMRISRIR